MKGTNKRRVTAMPIANAVVLNLILHFLKLNIILDFLKSTLRGSSIAQERN